MSNKTKIPWTDKTWNPVVGCTKCSPGCLNCYAERMANRLCWMGKSGYEIATDLETGKWTGHITCMKSRLDKPLHWKKPCKIFVCSMSDLFHPKVPFEFIDKIFDVIQRTPDHTYQILTKRPKRMADFIYQAYGVNHKLDNAWLGVSISTQPELDQNLNYLMDIPAAMRFVSLEPLLEDIRFRPWHEDLNWVIVGCESGPNRRPCKIEWVQSIVEQCKAANVPVFVKQINVNGKLIKMPKDFPQEYPN